MYLPPELVREIFKCVFDLDNLDSSETTPTEELGVPRKQKWCLIQPLTLTCKAYRALSLEFWFHTFFLQLPADIPLAHIMFPDLKKKWTRYIHCVQTDSKYTSIWNLQGFGCLSTIRLDWLSPRMMPHHGSDDPADRLPFTNVPSSVNELDIRGLPWPSPLVFHNIGGILPELKVLKMRQPKIWCGLCHTCSVVRFRSPGPKIIVYEGGLGLPMHYARVFRTLQHLHTVYITIADFGSGSTIVSAEADKNQHFWTGECDRCMYVMYEDAGFRDRWVARKRGIILEGHEKETVYIRPAALKRVEWRFWAARDEEEVDFLESADENSEAEDVV
ncbi:hypothetical protein BDZ94DRAFT_1158922 [Collybia nuda]|uniref:F-box domain-containing protein n=1 Tax=Collybia nuda TaxID=64659 RepID=A0A9P5YBX6_9AGAR|nr:hypothetical protein BDZ94DRAFT_1158922 [Collybia nuda]